MNNAGTLGLSVIVGGCLNGYHHKIRLKQRLKYCTKTIARMEVVQASYQHARRWFNSIFNAIHAFGHDLLRFFDMLNLAMQYSISLAPALDF